jgi:hypothetical protein
MKPYEQLPFTNKLNQVIEPGDRIVVVTSGRGSTVNTYDGVYLGRRTSKDWRGNDQSETVVEVSDTDYDYFIGDSEVKCSWNHPEAKRRRFPCTRKTTLWRNQIFKLA